MSSDTTVYNKNRQDKLNNLRTGTAKLFSFFAKNESYIPESIRENFLENILTEEEKEIT